MEKLTMNAPKETLRVRMRAALDAGIDGITLAAGLHLGSFALIEDHPRFRDAKLGIIVSSVRALQLFLKKSSRTNRLARLTSSSKARWLVATSASAWTGPNTTWRPSLPRSSQYLKTEHLDIPVIPAGGIFTGSDATAFLENGAAAVQVATRFTVTEECGLPADVKQEYFKANEDDIVVNEISPTGYPMRMIRSSPGDRRRHPSQLRSLWLSA
jgi:nitronate monooxygenase